MVPSVKAPAAKANGLSSVPGTHIVEGENQLPEVVLQLQHVHKYIHTCIHMSYIIHRSMLLKVFKRRKLSLSTGNFQVDLLTMFLGKLRPRLGKGFDLMSFGVETRPCQACVLARGCCKSSSLHSACTLPNTVKNGSPKV